MQNMGQSANQTVQHLQQGANQTSEAIQGNASDGDSNLTEEAEHWKKHY